MVTLNADRALHVLLISSINSVCSWICQQYLSSVIILTRRAYLQELIESCII
jgi:hypothetical protein